MASAPERLESEGETPGRAADLTIADVMSRNPVTVDEEARLSEALQLMKTKQIQHLPVLRDGCLVGLLSERHLRDAQPSVLALHDEQARQRSLYLTRVSSVCVHNPLTASPRDSLRQAIRKLRAVRGGSLPVLADGKLVGILTTGDLLTLLERLLEE